MDAITALSVMGTGGSNEAGRGIIAGDNAVYITGQYNAQPFIAKYNKSFAHAKVKSVKAVNAGSSYSPRYCGIGAKVSINVNFDAKVKVEGTPKLELNIENNGTKRSAEYKSGTGTKTLTFEYTIAAGDSTGGKVLEVSGEEALNLDGGSIFPAAGGSSEDMNLTLPVQSNNLGSGFIYIKTEPTTVKEITSDADAGTYGKGATIPITVTFDDNIKTVTGSPELVMNTGGKAIYQGLDKNSKSKMKFEYIVGNGESAEALECSSVTLPDGASIKDNFDSDMDLKLPAAGETGSLSIGKKICINQETVVVENVTIDGSYSNKAYRKGAEIPIKVEFSQGVTTTGNMELKLNASENYNSAKAVAEPVTNKNVVTFTYTVGEGESLPADTMLDYSSVSALTLSKGADISSGNNPVSLYLPKPGSQNALS